MPPIDKAGRQIAGLLTYNPGPGIYSRLERAIQAMPENVRVQELPGLLKRYKDGVPGWELKATDLDSVIAGRDMVPRDELLGAVRERSPVYTHKEVVLGGDPQMRTFETGATGPAYAQSAGRIGEGRPVGRPKFKDYGQGGEHYGELLLLQPDAGMAEFGSHWTDINAPGGHNAVAHARYDTHGDALRINELQSDLGIHNRKIREIENGPNVTARYGDQVYATDDMGIERPVDPQLPFPMEDAWADLLIKRMALEAARKGHRAIEVASPRAIADKVGGNIDNYEHFYGKVVPGALERLGRKMGGLARDANVGPEPVYRRYVDALREQRRRADQTLENADAFASGLVGHPTGGGLDHGSAIEGVAAKIRQGRDPTDAAETLYTQLWATAAQRGWNPEAAKAMVNKSMPHLMRQAEDLAHIDSTRRALQELDWSDPPLPPAMPPGRRYLMSDEMRRRLIQEGVGAAVAGGILSQDDLIERLRQ